MSHDRQDLQSVERQICELVEVVLNRCESYVPVLEAFQHDPQKQSRLRDQVVEATILVEIEAADAVLDGARERPDNGLIAIAAQEVAAYAQAIYLSLRLGLSTDQVLGWKPERIHLGLVEGDRKTAIAELVRERIRDLREEFAGPDSRSGRAA